MMSSISEVARPSNLSRPKRCRPRRAGLSKYFLRPLIVYNLDESIAQLQIYQLTLFTGTRRATLKNYYSTSASASASSLSSTPAYFEIGEEIPMENYQLTDISFTSSFSRMLCIYTLLPCNNSNTTNNINSSISSSDNHNHNHSSESLTILPQHLRYLLNSPETVLHILPIQLNGIVILITDQIIWCLRDPTLHNWITSKIPIDKNTPKHNNDISLKFLL
ncbi:unnamed protein product [Schistosoma turkestanicum]|nr:unnamed protein product [Schistosoma turkestanicum]